MSFKRGNFRNSASRKSLHKPSKFLFQKFYYPKKKKCHPKKGNIVIVRATLAPYPDDSFKTYRNDHEL